ncbi:Pantothenate synthetase [Chlamydia trachomatis]|nr:Pantothenate synthetase [Chlamydia trachomatis]
MKAVFAEEPLCSLEYICLVDADTMQEIPVVAGNVVCCMAARIQNVRLIDNFWWSEHANA